MFLKKIKGRINKLDAQISWIKNKFEFDKIRKCDNCGGLFHKDYLIEQDKPKTKYYKSYGYVCGLEIKVGGKMEEIDENEYKELKEEGRKVKREFKRQLFCKNCNQN